MAEALTQGLSRRSADKAPAVFMHAPRPYAIGAAARANCKRTLMQSMPAEATAAACSMLLMRRRLMMRMRTCTAGGGPSTSYMDDPTYGVPPEMPVTKAPGQKGQKASPAPGQKRPPGRSAGGERWRDPTLNEWPENDFRIFVGDLGYDCTDEILIKAFNKYSSFAKAKVRAATTPVVTGIWAW